MVCLAFLRYGEFEPPREGYETDERCSLGERADRCRWQREGGERVAAVKIGSGEEPRPPILGTATGQANAQRL